MKNKEVIQYIKNLNLKGRIRAITTKEKGGFVASAMVGYSGGSGLGYCSFISFLDVQFKTLAGAEKLKELINNTFSRGGLKTLEK